MLSDGCYALATAQTSTEPAVSDMRIFPTFVYGRWSLVTSHIANAHHLYIDVNSVSL